MNWLENFNPLNWMRGTAGVPDEGPDGGEIVPAKEKKEVEITKQRFSQYNNNYNVQRSPITNTWQVRLDFKNKENLNEFLRSPPPQLVGFKDGNWRHKDKENSCILSSREARAFLNNPLEFEEIMETIAKNAGLEEDVGLEEKEAPIPKQAGRGPLVAEGPSGGPSLNKSVGEYVENLKVIMMGFSYRQDSYEKIKPKIQELINFLNNEVPEQDQTEVMTEYLKDFTKSRPGFLGIALITQTLLDSSITKNLDKDFLTRLATSMRSLPQNPMTLRGPINDFVTKYSE